MKDQIMKILLVEDEPEECNKYKRYAEIEKSIELSKITNSETEALQYINKQKLPDGIILDLELNNGEGSGIDFLKELEKMKLNKRPKIVVTTNVFSNSVYDYLHDRKVDFIFYKKQKGYSVETVVNTLLMLKGYEEELSGGEIEEDEETEKIIKDSINNELDTIGVGTHLQGRKYLYDAIYFVITNKDEDNRLSIVQHLTSKYKKASSTISKAMQNAILYAWRVSPLEDIEKIYTAKINYETGVPTPTEFIYFYADKIKKTL